MAVDFLSNSSSVRAGFGGEGGLGVLLHLTAERRGDCGKRRQFSLLHTFLIFVSFYSTETTRINLSGSFSPVGSLT